MGLWEIEPTPLSNSRRIKCEERQREENIYVSMGNQTVIPNPSDTTLKNLWIAKSCSRDLKLGSLAQISVLTHKSHVINYFMNVAYGNQIETLAHLQDS